LPDPVVAGHGRQNLLADEWAAQAIVRADAWVLFAVQPKAPSNKCETLDNQSVVRFRWMVDAAPVVGAKCAGQKTTKSKSRTMKKLIAAAIAISFGAAMVASAADAKENWDKQCAKCHGPDGKGQTKMGQKLGIKDLTDAKIQAEATDEVAFKAIKEGVKDKEGKQTMKAAEGLSDDDIKALVKHVRTLKK
jgi:cytochrome c553